MPEKKHIPATRISINIINIEDTGCHLYINAKIEGKEANLLIDTGASRTVFDRQRLEAFVNNKPFTELDKLSTGLGTDSMRGHTVHIDSLDIGAVHIKDYTAMSLDLTHVNESYAKIGIKPIDGVLGGDILSEYNANINYKTKKLQLEKK